MPIPPDDPPQPLSREAATRPRESTLRLAVATLRSIAVYLALSIYVLIVGPPGMLLVILLRAPGIVHVLARTGVRVGFWIAGISAAVTGRENVPRDRSFVFSANHQSNIDAPLLYLVLHNPLHLLFKAEFGRVPILGRAAQMGGFVPIERTNREQAIQALDGAVAQLQQGYPFLFFPEGTRSRSDALQPFKKGGFIMAIQAQAPVIPVAMRGARLAMPRGSWIMRPVRCRVRIGTPIETNGMTVDDRDRLIEEVRAQMETLLAAQD